MSKKRKGLALLAWRRANKKRQIDVAILIQVTQMTICRAEKGRPISKKTIIRLVDLGAGALSHDDFRERRPKGKKANGSKSKREEAPRT